MRPKLGSTPILKIDNLSKKYKLPSLLIKDESQNPFGTFKDRRSELIIRQALKKKIDTVAIITAGNAGFSLTQYAKGTTLKVVCIVDNTVSYSVYKKLSHACHKVIKLDLSRAILDSQQIIALVRTSPKEKIWNVTNGWEICYQKIIQELKKTKPDFVITPVGSGESFVGLYQGIKKYKLKTTLIGASPASFPSVADKLHTNWTPYAKKLKSITREKHRIIHLSESEIKQAYTIAKKYVQCEPSSAIVFGVLKKCRFKPYSSVVLINSGKTK